MEMIHLVFPYDSLFTETIIRARDEEALEELAWDYLKLHMYHCGWKIQENEKGELIFTKSDQTVSATLIKGRLLQTAAFRRNPDEEPIRDSARALPAWMFELHPVAS